MPKIPLFLLHHKLNPCGGAVQKMDTKTIIDEIFKKKFGERAEGYDTRQIPDWDTNFKRLYNDLIFRHSILVEVKRLNEKASLVDTHKDVLLKNATLLFKQLLNAQLPELLESIVAHNAEIIVYGIEICNTILPFVKDQATAMKFDELYCVLQENTVNIDVTLKNSKQSYWNNYIFKIGLRFLELGLNVKEKGKTFFEVNKNYCIYLKGQCMDASNPLSWIVYSMAEIPRNHYLAQIIQKDMRQTITSIIERK